MMITRTLTPRCRRGRIMILIRGMEGDMLVVIMITRRRRGARRVVHLVLDRRALDRLVRGRGRRNRRG